MQAQGTLTWSPPEDFRVHHEGLNAEFFVGGVYVRLFLKTPSFPLRQPKTFLEGLVTAYLADVAEGSQSAYDRALLVAAAVVELLRNHGGLAEHAVTLGYVERLLKLLNARLASAGKSSFNTLYPSKHSSPSIDCAVLITFEPLKTFTLSS